MNKGERTVGDMVVELKGLFDHVNPTWLMEGDPNALILSTLVERVISSITKDPTLTVSVMLIILKRHVDQGAALYLEHLQKGTGSVN